MHLANSARTFAGPTRPRTIFANENFLVFGSIWCRSRHARSCSEQREHPAAFASRMISISFLERSFSAFLTKEMCLWRFAGYQTSRMYFEWYARRLIGSRNPIPWIIKPHHG